MSYENSQNIITLLKRVINYVHEEASVRQFNFVRIEIPLKETLYKIGKIKKKKYENYKIRIEYFVGNQRDKI